METEGCSHFQDVNQVTQSLQGKLLYKDQCTKCFDDPKQSFLHLCLKCYNGSCGAHSQEHMEKFNHYMVLEIRIVPDEEKIKEHEAEKARNEGKEITKLAIGKAGGYQDTDSNEFYKSVSTVKCLKCNVEVEKQKLQGIIQSIEQTESAFKKQDLASWEAEAFPCEHTLTLQQSENAKVANMDGATCGSCSMSKNLWMCLTCGNLGCGRKEGGGNEHGILHGVETGHPLVVKMGTITANGEASLYCYTCNDDVKDPNLPIHLSCLGINIQNQKKTEKTVAELNLDRNLNATLSSIVVQGKKLDPIFGPQYTGLVNLGNSCYINSVLQVLFHFEEIQNIYYKQGLEHLKTCDKLPATCFYCQFSKLGEGLVSGKYSIKKEIQLPDNRQNELEDSEKYFQDGLKIYDLKQLIAGNNAEFSGNKMQDALEYYQHVLQFIQKNEKPLKLQNDTNKMFEFQQSTKLVCTGCQGVKYNQIKTTELKLPVRLPNQQELEISLAQKKKEAEEAALKKKLQQQQEQSNKMETENQEDKKENQEEETTINLEEPEYDTNFEECVNIFLEGDSVEVYCPQCKKNMIFSSQVYAKTLPQYLVIPFQRFVVQNWQPYKLNALIDMPDSFDFKKIVLKQAENENILEEQQDQQQQQQKPQINEVALEMLMQMGMTKNRCIRALLANNNDPDAAINWMFERMDDASLDAPIEEEKKQNNASFSPENVSMIMSMGFTEKAAKIGLQQTKNDVERAIDYLFSHQEDIDKMELQEEEQQQEEKVEKTESYEDMIGRSDYELVSVIVHLGKVATSGHYVCYSKVNGKWVFFNDNKVAHIDNPSLNKGYIAFFKRK